MSKERITCASCGSSDSGGGKEMCVVIDGKHHHVLICIGCHLKEIETFMMAALQVVAEQQKTIDKLTKKPKLGVVQ